MLRLKIGDDFSGGKVEKILNTCSVCGFPTRIAYGEKLLEHFVGGGPIHFDNDFKTTHVECLPGDKMKSKGLQAVPFKSDGKKPPTSPKGPPPPPGRNPPKGGSSVRSPWLVLAERAVDVLEQIAENMKGSKDGKS